LILTKPTNFSNVKYSYPNLTKKKNPNQIQKSHPNHINFRSKFLHGHFLSNQPLLLQCLYKIPIQINLPPLQSLKDKKSLSSLTTTPQLLLYPQQQFAQSQKSISLEQQHHETPNTMEKIKEASFVLTNLVIHNHQKKQI